jgi:Tol biopolymer transport system component
VVLGLGASGQQAHHIGIYDLSGTMAMRRLTVSGSNRFPIWSPDGRRVAFQSDREGDPGLFWQRADGSGAPERLTKPEPGTSHEPDAWSPDGQTLLFEVVKGDSSNPLVSHSYSLWTLSLRDRKVERFGTVESPWHINATFASNGRWVAYAEGEGSASRVYVEPYPRTGDRYPVTNDARTPVWSPNGRELFYTSGLDQLRAVTVSTQPTVTFGNPVLMFRGGLQAVPSPNDVRRGYDLSPDGGRILGVVAAQTPQQALAPTIQVVTNWFEELKAKVP